MASDTDIAAVKVELPDEAASLGYTDELISASLDSDNSVIKTILLGWRAIAAKTALATDVNESGSSRNFSAINAKALQMITHYQMLADREDLAADILPIRRFASHRITRV